MKTEDGDDKSLIRKGCIDSQFVSAEGRRFTHSTEGKNRNSSIGSIGGTVPAQ